MMMMMVLMLMLMEAKGCVWPGHRAAAERCVGAVRNFDEI